MRRRRRCIGERRGRKQFTHARAESAEGVIVADGPETKPLCHTAHRLDLLAKSFMYNVMRIHINKNRILVYYWHYFVSIDRSLHVVHIATL